MGFRIKDTSTTISCFTEELDSDIVLTSSSDYEDTGISLTLPTAGKYQLRFNITARLSGSAPFDNKWAEVALYNATDTTYVVGGKSFLFIAENLGPNADYFICQCLINCFYTITAPKVIKLRTKMHSIGSGLTITEEHTSYGYMLFS